MRSIVLVLALYLLGHVPATPVAHGQDDWDVKRDPFDRQVIAKYKRLLARNPSDRGALSSLRALYKRHRTVDKLIGEYKSELDKKPDDFSVLVVLGHLEMDRGQSAAALPLYEKASGLRPKDPGLAKALGDLYRGAGQGDKAREAYIRALAHDTRKNKPTLLRLLSQLAMDRGDLAAARKRTQELLVLEPKNAQIRFDLADALARAKKFEEAVVVLRDAENALKSDPLQRIEVAARIGQTFEAAGSDEKAITEYRRAIGLMRRGYYLQRELTERILEINRRRQTLPALIAEFEKSWPNKSRGHYEWDVLARLYEETGLQEKALAAYKKAVGSAPYELETQRRLIALFENAGLDEQAIKQYEAVIRVAPGEPRFQLELAERYWRKGAEKKAIAMLEKLGRRFTGDAGVHSALADLYTRWGKEDQALKAYQRLTKIEPSEIHHLVNLGDQYFQRGNRAKALSVWKKIIRRGDAKAYAQLGEVYAEHDMDAEALEMFGKAIRLKPKDASLYKGRSTVHEGKKQFTKAIADLDMALDLIPATQGPIRRDLRRRIINLLKRTGGTHLNRRMTEWARAFAKKPQDLEAGYFLSEAHQRLGQYAAAKTVLETLLRLEPGNSVTNEQLVNVYRAEHDYEKAIALLKKLAAESPGRKPEYYGKIAEIKTLQHKDGEAIEYAQKALSESPNDPVAHFELAQRYEDMQKYAQAIAAYERVREIAPRNYPTYFALARLYRNDDQLAKAAELYREVITRASDGDILDRAGRAAINLEELTGTLGNLERVVAPLAFSLGHKEVYRTILVRLYERYVPGLVAKVRGGTEAEKTEARAELARLGAHGLKPLLQALGDSRDPSQRRIAISVLGFLGNRGAAQPLVRIATESSHGGPTALRGNSDIDMRVEALVAAGRLGDPRIIPELEKLSGYPELAIRQAAIFALGVTASAKASKPLMSALDDEHDSVRTMACLSLARAQDPQATRTISAIEAVVNDTGRPDATRAACAYALGVARTRSAQPTLLGVLDDGNDELQRLAAWALGRIGASESVPHLFRAYFATRDRVRESVAWALVRVAAGGDDTSVAIDFLNYPMRSGIIDLRTTIAELAPHSGIPPISSKLLVGNELAVSEGIHVAFGNHRDALVRALQDLDMADSTLSLGILTERMAEATPVVRAQVKQVLQKVGSTLVPSLKALAEHSDSQVRGHVASIAGKIGASGTEAILERGLKDRSHSVRASALLGIAHYVVNGGPQAERLAKLAGQSLGSKSWRQRAAAALALGQMGAQANHKLLSRAAIHDQTAFVREAAIMALAKTGAPAAVPTLIQATAPERERVPEVRGAAVRALAAFGTPRARKRLNEVAEADPDPAIRKLASGLIPR